MSRISKEAAASNGRNVQPEADRVDPGTRDGYKSADLEGVKYTVRGSDGAESSPL